MGFFRHAYELLSAAGCPRLGHQRSSRRKAALAQGWRGGVYLGGSGTFRYPTLKPRLLIACAVHVCESKQSIEVRKNRIATSVCAA